MDDIVLATPGDLANGVTVPPHTTADYIDADGNTVAHFDQPRPYEKLCKVSHFAEPEHDYKFPITVHFVVHPTPETSISIDSDF